MTVLRSFALSALAILVGAAAAHAGRTRLPLACIDLGYGLYGQVEQGSAVLHSWFGPCTESSSGRGWWVEHAVLETSIRSVFWAEEAGLVMTATAQARFEVDRGRTYHPIIVARLLHGPVHTSGQGLMIGVICPGVSPQYWWYPWPAPPSFVAPATGTCDLLMRDVCFADGRGACIAEAAIL